MAMVEMRHLTAFVLEGEKDRLIRRLMQLRCLEVTALPEETVTGAPEASAASPPPYEKEAARVDRALALLHQRSRRRPGRQRPVAPDADSYPRSDDYAAAQTLLGQVEALSAEEDACREQLAQRENENVALACYEKDTLPLSLTGTRTTRLLRGVLPAGASATALTEELLAHDGVLFPLHADATGTYVTLLYHEDEEEEVLQVLGQASFMRLSLPAVSCTAAEQMRKNTEARQEIRARLEALREESAHLAECYDLLEVLSDYCHTRARESAAAQSLPHTAATRCLTAWVPAPDEKRVGQVLESFSCAYTFRAPQEGEDPPVLLRNPSLLHPFEDVMAMYSLPAYGTYDPTWLMSIFYFVIFGLMLADVGYGLMLTALCLIGLRILRPTGTTRRLIQLFAICGVSCMLCGALLGGYFGDLPVALARDVFGLSEIGGVPIDDWTPALLFDPLKDTATFLVVSLVMGVVHISAGMVIQMFILFRQKRVAEALFDVGAWLVIFAGVGIYFLHATAGLVTAAVGLLTVFLTHGRHAKNPVMKFLGGFMGLYSFISYISDVLSYARIMALGLASAVIAQVINMTAGMIHSGVGGVIFFVLLFIVGHVANLAINLLGTYVHTSRLQYIEFFGKFFVDGGRPFVPLEAVSQYTDASCEAENPT